MRKILYRRTLQLTRAWFRIRNSHDPDQVLRLASDIVRSDFRYPHLLARLAGVPASMDDAFSRSIPQQLQERMYTNIQPEILRGIGGYRGAVALPREWRNGLSRRGVKLASLGSAVAWRLHVWKSLLRGVALCAGTLVRAAKRSLPPAPNTAYHVFLDVPASLIPSKPADFRVELSLLAWVRARYASGQFWLCNSTPNAPFEGMTHTQSPLPQFPSKRSLLTFSILSLRAVIAATIDAVGGRGLLASNLRELIRLNHAMALPADHFPETYIAENSRWFVRPLFTEFAKLMSATQTHLVFYATNMDHCMQLEPNGCEITFTPGYQGMSWDRYLVWDQHHADLAEAWGHAREKVEIVGPVPFASRDGDLPTISDRSVAVFDISPLRPTQLARIGLIPRYLDDEIVAQFLDDIVNATTELSIDLLLKRKRAAHSKLPYRYEKAMDRLIDAPNAREVDHNIAATNIIERATATISLPFSSPSVLAQMANKPTVFYDPTSRLRASDRQRHGIPVLRGSDELKAWLIANV